MLYRAWKEGWGPRYFLIGVSRRISHRARIEWQDQREAEAAAAEAKKVSSRIQSSSGKQAVLLAGGAAE
jgi:hypothetical protein